MTEGPRAAWLRASARIADSVLNGAEIREVLDEVTAVSREVSGADLALLALPDDDGRMTVEFADGEGAQAYVGIAVEPHPALPAGGDEPVRLERLADAGLLRSPAAAELGRALVQPVVAEGRSLGLVICVREPGSTDFDADEVQTLRSFADQAAIGLQMSRMARERERLVVLEDRDRIARDLHDLVLQRLFAAGLTLQGVVKDPTVNDAVRERVERVVDDLDVTVVEVRQAVFALREVGSGRPIGLRGRVLRDCAAAARWLGFQPSIGFRGAVDSAVGDAVAEQLLVALREALANVARHANATWTQVSVQLDGDDVVLSVTDDGRGVGDTDRRSGLGNLARRAEELGGSSTVEPTYSATGRGTRLTWRVPVR